MGKYSERREREREPQRTGEFPVSYADFKRFLEERPDQKFDMESSCDCAGAACAGYPLDEVYLGPRWFNEFQRRVHKGGSPRRGDGRGAGNVWTGKGLLSVLREIDPVPFPGASRRR